MVKNGNGYLSLTFKCQSTAVVLVGPLAVAGRVLKDRVCPPFHPTVCCVVFFRIGSSGFSEFRHGTRISYLVVPKNLANGPKTGQK